MSEFGGLECSWSDLTKHPICPHGPTLLFGKNIQGELKQFYACSACRDRKLCPFYAEKDGKFTEAQKKAWKAEAKKATPSYNHRRLFLRFNEAMGQTPEKRAYCHNCNKLVMFSERPLHAEHEMLTKLTDEEMHNPSKILKPLANVKKEAQYLFSDKATIDLVKMLDKAGAKQILCIGVPRLHEYIMQNMEHKMSSLLLDFDARFHNFFGPLSYCWYNLFNNHFFTEEGSETFRDFMTQNDGKDTFIVCDPPFGGRVEPMSRTLKTIEEQHKQWNKIEADGASLKIMFIFPYFMEPIMRQKSNPPGIDGGLKNLEMSDYKVDYENHPLFVTGSRGRKHGSPVRIFTNISLKLLELPLEDGYKFCAKCQKWVAPENKHCKKCNSCTSKDGRLYKHCDICKRCVKPTWKHCDTCERCVLEKHACGQKPKITGRCFKCGDQNHISKDCEISNSTLSTTKSSKKRKNVIDQNGKAAKKQKTVISENGTTKNRKNAQKRKHNVAENENSKKQENIAPENGEVMKKRKKKSVGNGELSNNCETEGEKKVVKKHKKLFNKTEKEEKTENKLERKTAKILQEHETDGQPKTAKKPEKLLAKTEKVGNNEKIMAKQTVKIIKEKSSSQYKIAPKKTAGAKNGRSKEPSSLENTKNRRLPQINGNTSTEVANEKSTTKGNAYPKIKKTTKAPEKTTKKQKGRVT